MRWPILVSLLMTAMLPATSVNALCSGASMAQEFQMADVVVRAHVVAETNTWDDTPSADYKRLWGDGAPVRLYDLQVVEIFKGTSPGKSRLFEESNSGSFYLEADRDYLLLLNAIPAYTGRPLMAKGAFYVRHACGQSKPWLQLQANDLAELKKLSQRK